MNRARPHGSRAANPKRPATRGPSSMEYMDSNALRLTRLHFLLLASLLAIATASVGCGETSETVTQSRCEEVSCPLNQSCDEADGVCKCGDGALSVVCLPSQDCVLDPSPQCVASLCQFVQCERGETCDRFTGLCSCGGERCAEDELCVDERCQPADSCLATACTAGMECDPTDGFCKCDGVRCEAGEACVDGACVFDRCLGVNCAENAVCNPDDGACHCGGAEGPICQIGEACADRGEGFECILNDLCADANCVGGTVCDPTDGQCRCGGVGGNAPVCTSEQTCIDGQCRGGGLCPPPESPNACVKGTSCDPADGVCKCGGAGGEACEQDEACVRLSGDFVCSTECDIFASPTGCGRDEGCYYDSNQPIAGTFCAPAGGAGLDQSCAAPNDCEPGLYCNPSSKSCRRLCDTSEGNLGCAGIGGGVSACAQIPGGPEGLGFCITG